MTRRGRRRQRGVSRRLCGKLISMNHRGGLARRVPRHSRRFQRSRAGETQARPQKFRTLRKPRHRIDARRHQQFTMHAFQRKTAEKIAATTNDFGATASAPSYEKTPRDCGGSDGDRRCIQGRHRCAYRHSFAAFTAHCHRPTRAACRRVTSGGLRSAAGLCTRSSRRCAATRGLRSSGRGLRTASRGGSANAAELFETLGASRRALASPLTNALSPNSA